MSPAAAGNPVVIAQVSDLHVSLRPGGGGIDAAERVGRCLRSLGALAPRPDLLVASGDLVDRGEPGEYGRLHDLLGAVDIPLCLMPGNHDRRAALRAAFPEHDYLGVGGRIDYRRELRGLGLVMLDSVIEGEDGGGLDQAQLQWLEDSLASRPALPVLLFLHHPPVATGFARMDRIALAAEGARGLGGIVARHPQVKGVFCGHVHRSVQVAWQGIMVSVCPSAAFQARLRLGPGRFEPDAEAPPAYQLHCWDGVTLATHTVTV